jgi:hypothetical protein
MFQPPLKPKGELRPVDGAIGNFLRLAVRWRGLPCISTQPQRFRLVRNARLRQDGAETGGNLCRLRVFNRRGHRLADIAATMKEVAVLTLVIGILIIVVVGAILFWVIDKFCPDARLAQLLKLLVVLVCLAAIVNRLLPLLGYPSVL